LTIWAAALLPLSHRVADAHDNERAAAPRPAHLYGAVTAEDLVALDHEAGDGFVEVYNGHSGARDNDGAQHPDTERMRDIVRAPRLTPDSIATGSTSRSPPSRP
jgi:hypothetical protein